MRHISPAISTTIRLIVATARRFVLPVVTRDSKILAYAKAGHVRAVSC